MFIIGSLIMFKMKSKEEILIEQLGSCIIRLDDVNYNLPSVKFQVDNALEKYAKQEAFLFYAFKRQYQIIEGMNVRHYRDIKFKGGIISWVCAEDEDIWTAYKKGEQLKYWHET